MYALYLLVDRGAEEELREEKPQRINYKNKYKAFVWLLFEERVRLYKKK
jgi:hypothetical protein